MSNPAVVAAPPRDRDVLAWHRLDVDAVFAELDSSPDGLSPAAVHERLATYGPNELQTEGSTSPWKLLWQQLTAVMVVILMVAAVLSLLLGKLLEAGAIGGIVVLFTLLGFVQEYRAERAIAALRSMSAPTVRAVREGRAVDVAAGELVPGDVVRLEAGSVVPADLRLVEVASLRIQESALTGESEPVDKRVDAIDADAALGDRQNLAFAGTEVTVGRGTGVVVATGMRSELGKIAGLLGEVRSEQTPLQRRLDRVGIQLAIVGVVVAVAVATMGAIAGVPFSDLVLTAISVAVAVIPEGLPAVVTVTLAIGAQRMVRRNALVRKLPAVETLGSVTTICSDKTGTLTENKMTVTVVDVLGEQLSLRVDSSNAAPVDASFADVANRNPALSLTLVAGALCNDGEVEVDDDGELVSIGDPTETALLHAAHRCGIDIAALRDALPRVAEQPFDSTRKRMSTIHGPSGAAPANLPIADDQPVAFVKGAIDGLLEVASHIWDHDRPVPLDDDLRAQVLESNNRLAAGGLRVLGVAYRPLDGAGDSFPDDVEHDLVIVGLVGIIDPPRPEVRDAVATCRAAGIRPIMITGDHQLTATSIAAELGIGEGDPKSMTGADLDRIDDAALREAVAEVSVFSRVSPEHKLRIVAALQDRGEVVSMTGDGVNDAPALKRADIGVAMGITGTDVSKEAADMVLRDDNFTTIVSAVEEGRVIYDNLRRFVAFAVAGNLGKIIVMLAWPIPFMFGDGDVDAAVALLPLQLLWLNLMTDGLLGLSMGVEPAARNVMQRPPHGPGTSLWAGGLGRQTVWVGALIGIVSLAVGAAYYQSDSAAWQTMIFTTVAFMQIAQAIGTRSTTDTLRTIGWRSNPTLLALAAVVLVLQLLAVTTPLREFLSLEPLSVSDLAAAALCGVGLLVILELTKLRRSRAGHEGDPVNAG